MNKTLFVKYQVKRNWVGIKGAQVPQPPTWGTYRCDPLDFRACGVYVWSKDEKEVDIPINTTVIGSSRWLVSLSTNWNGLLITWFRNFSVQQSIAIGFGPPSQRTAIAKVCIPPEISFSPWKLAAYWYGINSIFSEFLLIEFWADASLMWLPTFG